MQLMPLLQMRQVCVIRGTFVEQLLESLLMPKCSCKNLRSDSTILKFKSSIGTGGGVNALLQSMLKS